MVSETKRWVPFDPQRQESNGVFYCFLAKVFYIGQARSAWAGRPSLTYPGFEAFHPTLAKAESFVETERKQGSTWTIEELPAIAIAGYEPTAIVITQINTRKTLAEFTNTAFDKPGLIELAEAIKSSRDDSVIKIEADKEYCRPAELPFKKHSSRSSGQVLDWQSKRNEIDVTHVCELVKRITLLLQQYWG